MATFVLVHGATAGGWIWQPVARMLRAAGHEVFTPTLTGLGERVHLVNPQVGLETHITDVINLLEYEMLEEVIVVGHSYAGMVITGVADRMPERISRLVYLDAYLPADGQSVWDMANNEPAGKIILEAVKAFDGYRIPPDPSNPRYTPMPIKAVQDPIHLVHPATLEGMHPAFIYCTGDKENPDPAYVPIIQAAARVRQDPRWDYSELPNNHEANVENPEGVTRRLLELL